MLPHYTFWNNKLNVKKQAINDNYKQERGCLVHFVRLTTYTTLLKDEGSTQDGLVIACDFARYSPI